MVRCASFDHIVIMPTLTKLDKYSTDESDCRAAVLSPRPMRLPSGSLHYYRRHGLTPLPVGLCLPASAHSGKQIAHGAKNMTTRAPLRVLVTGGGSFLGNHIAAMLLAEGADVSVLVRPGAEEQLGGLADRVRWWTTDVWDSASLRGHGRGHMHVVHTIGSATDDPAQGLNFHRLNFISTRNVANMCVSDGVPHITLLSAVRAPWLSRRYLRSKRESEQYLARVGLQATIIRAPLLYVRGLPRHPFYQLISLLGHTPPLSWLGLRQIAPMPVDVLARGVARVVLTAERRKRIYYAADLRRLNTRQELRQSVPGPAPLPPDAPPAPVHPFTYLDDNAPFGWTPGEQDRR